MGVLLLFLCYYMLFNLL